MLLNILYAGSFFGFLCFLYPLLLFACCLMVINFNNLIYRKSALHTDQELFFYEIHLFITRG